MKRLFLLFILLVPLIAAAQWSIVPSVGVGSTKMNSDMWRNPEGKLSYSVSVAARYSFGMLFASTGLGYQKFDAKLDFGTYWNETHYWADFKYSDIHIPISVGFQYTKTRLYPIAEAGLTVAFPLELKDRIGEVGKGSSVGEAKSIALAYFARAGIGYAFTDRLALEAKLNYTKTGNVSNYSYPKLPSSYDAFYTNPSPKTKWQSIGAQVSLAIKL